MLPVLLARNVGCIYTRIVYPDFIIQNIDHSRVIICHHLINMPGCSDIINVVAADMASVIEGTEYCVTSSPMGYDILGSKLYENLLLKCYNICRRVKSRKWTVFSSDYIDNALLELYALINDELFFA
jgi:hypothetical protein